MPVLLQYPFWLTLLGALCFGLERLFPWRREQRAFRAQFGQDLFWLAFNGHYLGLLLGGLVPAPAGPGDGLVSGWPLAGQFAALLVGKDLLEWVIHNLLHRVPLLWEFHKVHHTIEELDWIGNMRFHALEGAFYKALLYLPLAAAGADPRAMLAVAVTGTLVGFLNHANLRADWGPLRYVLNSPRMHVWHHDAVNHLPRGQNFAVVFSLWDWLFGTAHMPEGRPARLGFEGMERFPRTLAGRFFHPLNLRRAAV